VVETEVVEREAREILLAMPSASPATTNVLSRSRVGRA
jgi:hypothetical protein